MIPTADLADARRKLIARLLTGNPAADPEGPGVISGQTIPQRKSTGAAPLTCYQEQVYQHAQLAAQVAPDSLLYNETITIYRNGFLDVAALEQSLTEIVRRHEAWRTSFELVDGEARQIIHASQPVLLAIADLRDLPENERDAVSKKLALEDARRPFDLAKTPLFRFRLVRLDDEQYRLLLTAHQIILDGVSVYHVLLPELAALYAAYSTSRFSPLAEPLIQCADFAQWQAEQSTATFDNDLAFWRKQLQDRPLALEVPTDRIRPAVQTFRGAIQPFVIGKELADSLKNLTRVEGSTLFVTMLTGFVALLHGLTGEEDVIIGTLAPTRKCSEVQRLLGYFLNPVVLRVNVSGHPTFQELIRRVRDVVLTALSHDGLPFHQLVAKLQPHSDLSRNPMYQLQFSLEPPMPAVDTAWNLTPMDVESGGAKLDLYVVVDERIDGILGRAQYNPDLFDTTTITRLIEQYKASLQVMVTRPNLRVADRLAHQQLSSTAVL